MTVWELLVASSTLETGTALEHLNAQGDGGGSSTLVLADGVAVAIDTMQLNFSVDYNYFSVVVEPYNFNVEVDIDDEGL